MRRAPASAAGWGRAAARPPRFGRGYWLVVGEVVAFALGNVVLSGPLGLPRAVLPRVSFVVGVHFLALAKVWRQPSPAWVGAAVAACGAPGFAAAVARAGAETIAIVGGIAPGAALLAGGWWGATHPRRP